MTQQFGLGRAIQTAGGLQSLAGEAQRQGLIDQQQEMQARQQALAEQQAAQEAQQAQQLQQLRAQAFNPETGQINPEPFRQLLAIDPEVAGQFREQLGLYSEDVASRAVDEAAAFKQMLERDPGQAMNYYQDRLANNPAFAGLADNLQAGDIEGAIREIGYGVTLAGGQDAYNKVFGASQDPTAFMQEMIAAGIEPGSEEYKDAVLERYGKGQTIGFDVVEAVNPSTGRTEYYQVSRVDPGKKIPLGVEVPTDPRVQAAQAAQEAEAEEAQQQELGTINDMLQNIDQIVDSPGLSQWAGIEGWIPIVPGTEQANTDAYIERLKSQQFLENVGKMQGMGALSNAEGAKISAAAQSINRFMTDEAILKEMERVREELLKARERIESGNLIPQSERGTTNMSGRGEGRTQADRQANAQADAGAGGMDVNAADAFIDGILAGE